MHALFKEMTAFSLRRSDYLADDEFARLQQFLLQLPDAGPIIEGTGGLRKLRWSDSGRNKGKRGGTRVIYYWHPCRSQFWLFAIYGKDEADDLTPAQKAALRAALEAEVKLRG